jgi:limonene-1,2-epoxide hydrolase
MSSKEIVLSFLDALNSRDLKSAGNYVAEDVSFFAPDGAPVRGAQAYFNGWKPLGLRYEIKKTFADDNDVCVLYDITFSKPVVTLLACGLYSVDNGKISSIRVIFDPRPLFNNPSPLPNQK